MSYDEDRKHKQLISALNNISHCLCTLHKLQQGFHEKGVRPCTVSGRKALFHRWANKPQIYMSGTQETTVAIVEYENGFVEEVDPDKIRFLDNIEKKDAEGK